MDANSFSGDAVLATLWWPDTNPIGPGSLWPLCIVIFVAFIERITKWRAILFAASLLFAIAAILSAGFLFTGRRFPDADDFVGYYILSLSACCYALQVARAGSKSALLYGEMVLFRLGWFLMLEAVSRSAELIDGLPDLSTPWIIVGSTAVWCALFATLVHRVSRSRKHA